MMNTDVRWFNGAKCVGVVQIFDPCEGPKYYIGVGTGISEDEDITHIADWGSCFPISAGDVLFNHQRKNIPK